MKRPSRGPALNAALFLATTMTTTWAGAWHQGVDLLAEPGRWSVGVPYALALLAILGIHELGHYVTARRLGVDVSLPYFIPAPFFLGTFGAFIRMRGRIRSPAAHFDIGIAGPLAGLAVALVATWWDLSSEDGSIGAVFVWAIAGLDHPPAGNELIPAGPGRLLLGAITGPLFLSIIIPWPG